MLFPSSAVKPLPHRPGEDPGGVKLQYNRKGLGAVKQAEKQPHAVRFNVELVPLCSTQSAAIDGGRCMLARDMTRESCHRAIPSR